MQKENVKGEKKIMKTKEMKRRGTRGITLIALVVTIVVLLILAGTAIAMLTEDDGIIKNAQKGKDETEIGEEKEIITLAVGSALSEEGGYEIKREHLNTALANHIGTEGEDYTLSETEPYIVKYLDSGRSYIIDENGKVSEYIDITEYGVEVGQYVAYNPTVKDLSGTPIETEKLTYTSQKGDGQNHGNGNSPQTFTAKASTKWKILSIENGTVTLISEDVIKTDEGANFMLSGAVGYLYAEQELNEVCKIYGYGYGADKNQVTTYSYGGPKDGELTEQIRGSGARSITIEDINKYAGIKEDENGILRFSDGTMVDSNYGSTTNPPMDVYYPTIKTEDGNSGKVGVSNLKYTRYNYDKSKITNPKIRDIIFPGNYLLASRCIETKSSSAVFMVRTVGASSITNDDPCTGNSSNFGEDISKGYAVRPLVSLKSEVIGVDAGYNEAIGGWKLK